METTRYLKSIRVKNNYTQKDTAIALNISRATYSLYENDPLKCPLDIVLKIIDLFDGNIETFFNAIKQDYLS